MHELGFPNYSVAALVAAALLLVLGGCGGEDPEPAGDAAAEAVTVEHKFGTTEVPADPERVVAVGLTIQDFALALDVHPVGARQFQAGIDITGRPWAQDALGGEQPKLMAPRRSTSSGCRAAPRPHPRRVLRHDRPRLRAAVGHRAHGGPDRRPPRLRPSVAGAGPPDETALGRDDEAGTVVEDVEAEFARVRKAHPEFAGEAARDGGGPARLLRLRPGGPAHALLRLARVRDAAGGRAAGRGGVRRARERRAPGPARPGRARDLRRPGGVRGRSRVLAAARGPRGPGHLPRRGRRLRQRRSASAAR